MLHPLLFVALIYYLVKKITRYSRRFYKTYLRSYEFFRALAARRGGSLLQTGYRRFTYQPPGRNILIEIDCSSWPRMNLRMPQEFPFSISLWRMPRLIYAFAEAFISPQLRLDGLPYFPVASTGRALADLKDKQGVTSLLSELSTTHFSVQFTPAGLLLRKRLCSRDLSEEQVFQIVDVANDLAKLCGTPAAILPIHTVESDNRCAYCKEMIHEGDSVIHCSQCKTPHHSECFTLNGKCAVFGCDSSRPFEAQVPVLE